MKLINTVAIVLSAILLSGCIVHDHGRGGRWHDRDGYHDRHNHDRHDRGRSHW